MSGQIVKVKKEQTSISLPKTMLEAIDKIAEDRSKTLGLHVSRSKQIEVMLAESLGKNEQIAQ